MSEDACRTLLCTDRETADKIVQVCRILGLKCELFASSGAPKKSRHRGGKKKKDRQRAQANSSTPVRETSDEEKLVCSTCYVSISPDQGYRLTPNSSHPYCSRDCFEMREN